MQRAQRASLGRASLSTEAHQKLEVERVRSAMRKAQRDEIPEMLVQNVSQLVLGDTTLGFRTTAQKFDFTPAARCVTTQQPLREPRNVKDAAECEAWCEDTPGCNAAQLNHPWHSELPCDEWNSRPPEIFRKAKVEVPGPLPCLEAMQCVLYSHCLERVREARTRYVIGRRTQRAR